MDVSSVLDVEELFLSVTDRLGENPWKDQQNNTCLCISGIYGGLYYD